MNVKELQLWINAKIKSEGLGITLLKPDGQGGPLTRAAFIQVFVNKMQRQLRKKRKCLLHKV